MQTNRKVLISTPFDIQFASDENKYILVDCVYEREPVKVIAPVTEVYCDRTADQAAEAELQGVFVELAQSEFELANMWNAYVWRVKIDKRGADVKIEDLLAQYFALAHLHGYQIPEAIIIDPAIFEKDVSTRETETESEADEISRIWQRQIAALAVQNPDEPTLENVEEPGQMGGEEHE